MPWPVYLALKHLFPTGRGATRSSLVNALGMTLALATVLFAVLVAFLWWHGVLGRMREINYDSAASMIAHVALVWVYLTIGVAFIVMLFRCTPFFNAMSILGITLGVTVLLTVQSVMNGFANEYDSMFIKTQGNLIVHADGLIKNPLEIAQMLRQVPGVKIVEPVVFGVVMLQHGNAPAFPQIRSFDVDAPPALRNPMVEKLEYGKFDDLDDHSILLGIGLADQLRVNVGDHVDVYSPLMLDRLKNKDLFMPKDLRVAGIFKSKFAPYDNNTVGVTLRLMRELYNFDDEADAIEVRLDNDDYGHTLDVMGAIQKVLAPLNARLAANDPSHLSVETWQERNHDQLTILYVEKSVMFYIMVVIVIVAAFCILCSLATSVVRKTREIGVLGAMGAGPPGVAMIFCLQGLLIGVVGTFVGMGLAIFLLYYRQEIVTSVVDQRLMVEFYNFYAFPVQFQPWDFIKITGFTFFISTLAGILPAIWAARLKPADCLRYE